MADKKTFFIVSFTVLICVASLTSAAVTIPDPLGGTTFGGLLTKIASGVGGLIASLGAIMIIVAAIFYLTSAGNPQRMGVAKTALIYAIAGIVIGLAAEAIVMVVKEIVGVR